VLIFVRIRRREVAGAALIVLAATEIVYRMVVLDAGWTWQRVYNGLDTHSDGLLVGCGIAFLAASGMAARVPVWCSRLLAVLGFVGIVAVACWCHIDNGNQMDLAITVTTIGTALVLWSLLTAPVGLLRRCLASGLMVWVGLRSYGIYLWHFPMLLLIGNDGDYTLIARGPAQLGHFGSSVVVL